MTTREQPQHTQASGQRAGGAGTAATARRLHVEVQGRGPNLVLLHGWGLHSGVWDETVASLAQDYRVWRVDLPGHGRSRAHTADGADKPDWTLEGLATAVCTALPAEALRAHWVGWSLGGQVALQVALSRPERVSTVVLVAATPRFVSAPDWPVGVAPEVLAGFSRALAEDYRATLLRFLALQARGSERARDDVRRLRAGLFAHGEPAPQALRGGLAILAGTDLRARMASLQCPVGLMVGERDTLVPAAALDCIKQCCRAPRSTGPTQRAVSDIKTAVIAGAGHAPFLSHPQLFIAKLKTLLHG